MLQTFPSALLCEPVIPQMYRQLTNRGVIPTEAKRKGGILERKYCKSLLFLRYLPTFHYRSISLDMTNGH